MILHLKMQELSKAIWKNINCYYSFSFLKMYNVKKFLDNSDDFSKQLKIMVASILDCLAQGIS